MYIFDDLITKYWQEDLLKFSQNLPFAYAPGTSYQIEENGKLLPFVNGFDYFLDENTVDTPQFGHVSLYARDDGVDTNPSYAEYRPLFYSMQDRMGKKISSVYRVKVNCLLQNVLCGENNYNIAHVDTTTPKKLYSAIYYLNDSDGDTFMFNEYSNKDSLVEKLTISERITPKMGRVVIFPVNQFHASSNPIKNKSRFVVNFMFAMED